MAHANLPHQLRVFFGLALIRATLSRHERACSGNRHDDRAGLAVKFIQGVEPVIDGLGIEWNPLRKDTSSRLSAPRRVNSISGTSSLRRWSETPMISASRPMTCG